MAAPAPLTAEQLLGIQPRHKRVELVRGVMVVREPAGYRHGRVAAAMAGRLLAHVAATRAGHVLSAETGFQIGHDPDTVRAPDVAFVAAGRAPDPEPAGFARLAPDLVIEVLSPGDRPGEVLTKVADWLEAGTRLVWVVDPERRLGRVYRADGSERTATLGEALDGEDVVPGFSCPLSEVL
jgi:Uma2 family endonuclease